MIAGQFFQYSPAEAPSGIDSVRYHLWRLMEKSVGSLVIFRDAVVVCLLALAGGHRLPETEGAVIGDVVYTGLLDVDGHIFAQVALPPKSIVIFDAQRRDRNEVSFRPVHRHRRECPVGGGHTVGGRHLRVGEIAHHLAVVGEVGIVPAHLHAAQLRQGFVFVGFLEPFESATRQVCHPHDKVLSERESQRYPLHRLCA